MSSLPAPIASPPARTPAEPEPPRKGVLAPYFAAVELPRDFAAEMRELAAQGSVVFVMRASSVLNYLYLRWLCGKLGLPRLRAAVGLGKAFGWLTGARRGLKALKEAVTAGQGAVVFLGRNPGEGDPFPAVVQLQRTLPSPVFLVPALLVWSRRAQKLERSWWDVVLGSPEQPRALLQILAFLRNYKRAFLRVGRAIDLQAFSRERAAEDDAALARKVRGSLHHHLARETRAVLGPPLKSADRLRAEVMRDRSLREALLRVSVESGKAESAVVKEAEGDLREIASRFSPAFIGLMRPILSWIFNRLYDTVEIDEEGLERVRRAAAEKPLVLCPSHKSHVDYLILSYVFYEHGMTPPHVAAGINLSFWPFGSLARRGGAFFIRRSFKGDRVYTATMRAYVKRLLRDGFPQEFYVEGGRSRTGKLLFPKTGLLSMEVDAWLDGASDDVLFVPIAVDYEKLVEGKSYAHELAGGEKHKEDLAGLVRARKVLGGRYGRIYIQFAEPVSLKELAKQRLGKLAESLTAPTIEAEFKLEAAPALDGSPAQVAGRPDPAEAKRQLVQHVANRIAYGINTAMTVTPVGLVSAALLSHVKRGIAASDVAKRVELLRFIAAESGARFATGLPGATSDPTRPGPIGEAVRKLAADGLVKVETAAGETIYQVVDERRPLLDFYRNNVLHRYVALSLVAAALRASGADAPVAEVRERAKFLSRLFKLEFMYRVGATFDAIFAETVEFLARLGVVAEEDGRLRSGAERETLAFLADLIRAYLEAYRVAVDGLEAMAQPLDRKAAVKLVLERGRAAFLSGKLASREALSKALVDNAVQWLEQAGALAPAPGGKLLAAAPAWREGERARVLAELDRCLQAQ